MTPELHPQFRSIELDRLERPLGPLTAEVLHPLDRFFESHAISKRYALAQPTKSLVASARRLAFAFPMSLWMLRWLAADREPVADDMVQIVVALERGLELPCAKPHGWLPGRIGTTRTADRLVRPLAAKLLMSALGSTCNRHALRYFPQF